METRGGSKLVGMAIILMMILGGTVPAESSYCSKYCAEECFDSKMIQQCVIQCMKTCKPPASLSKPALDCSLGCANSNCKNIASGMEIFSSSWLYFTSFFLDNVESLTYIYIYTHRIPWRRRVYLVVVLSINFSKIVLENMLACVVPVFENCF